MKKLCILLCLLLVSASCAGAEAVPANPAAGDTNKNSAALIQAGAQNTGFEQIDAEIFQSEWERFEKLLNTSAPFILSSTAAYKYTDFAENISYNHEALLDAAQVVFDSKGEPTVEDYIDVLASLIVLCDMNSALSSAQSVPASPLEQMGDVLFDTLNVVWYTEISSVSEMIPDGDAENALKKKKQELSEAITVLLDGTKALSVEADNIISFTNALQSYQCCDRLLAQIEAHSDGNLNTAANLLRNAASYRAWASLNNILDVSVEMDADSLLTVINAVTNSEASSILIGADIPWDTIADAASFDNELGKGYASCFAAMEISFNLFKRFGSSGHIDYWEIMKSGGSMIADISFGLGTVSERIFEMRVLADIAQSLSGICKEQISSVHLPDEQLMRDTMLTLRSLLYCHMQGESTLYHMITQEMGLMSLIAFSSEKEFDLWYLKLKQLLHTHETQLNNVMSSWGLMGAVVPYSDPYTDFSKMKVAIEREDGYEIARTKLYDDGVYVFHEPREAYVILKLYIDGKLHKTIKNVTLAIENDIYVQQDIFLFDSPYPAFVKELVDQYGRSDLTRQQAHLSWGSGSERWPQRSGIAAAEVIDLNQDGYEELLVYRFVSSGGDTSQPNALKLYIYRTNEQSEVELGGRIDLLESRTRAYCNLRTGIIANENTAPSIYTERIERAADGYSIAYESYRFDGYTLQRQYRVGGSTDYYGALSMSGYPLMYGDSRNNILLWFGGGAQEFDYYSVSDLGRAEWASYSASEALSIGMAYVNFMPFADRSHNDEGRVVSFPARYDYPILFEYFCQGSDFDTKDAWAEEQSMLDELLEQAEEQTNSD